MATTKERAARPSQARPSTKRRPTPQSGARRARSTARTTRASASQTPQPRQHQQEALKCIAPALHLDSPAGLSYDSCLRALTVMACGTGKTMLGAFAAKQMWDSAEEWATKNGMQPVYAPVLVLVPSLDLAGQTIREWEAVFPGGQVQWRTVCAEASMSDYENVFQGDNIETLDPRYREAGQLNGTTKTGTTLRGGNPSAQPALEHSAEGVNNWLTVVTSRQRRLVVSTYHSLHHAADTKQVWGLVIEDEAHHCAPRGGAPTRSASKRKAGARRNKQTKSGPIYAGALDGTRLRALRRLALTATPRPLMLGDGRGGTLSDDFGPLVYSLPFSQAVADGLLANYRVVVQVKTPLELAQYLVQQDPDTGSKKDAAELVAQIAGQIRANDQPVEVTIDGERVRMLPHDLLCHVATSMFMAQHHLKRGVIYHNTIHRSKEFSKRHVKVVSQMPPAKRQGLGNLALVTKHINGNHSMYSREQSMDLLRDLKNELGERIEAMLVCNSRCISEGTDVPALDLVVLAEMRQSSEQLAQIIGRVMRKAPDKDTGYVLIPLLVDEEVLKDEDKFAKSGVLECVRRVIDALSTYDDMVVRGEEQDAYWAGYRASMGDKPGDTHTMRGLGANAPYWSVKGQEVTSSWDQGPEIDLSISAKDSHARFDILISAQKAMQKRDQKQKAMHRALRAAQVNIGEWASAVENRVVRESFQTKHSWWYTRGQLQGVLSEATGIE